MPSAAQVVDVHVQGVALDFVAETVHAVFQLLAGQHSPGFCSSAWSRACSRRDPIPELLEHNRNEVALSYN
ncbi:hypothetical protein O999_12030 [Pseudomonas putida LF54]|jgi:hypothetical protein|nr:hypothetical protein O999_12030 [Pseudomonas putida LF54]POF94628.1 hypothetical protein BGP83_18740 [Pseudomonas putida]POF95638.1 hypothetical protein BGP81_02425 [Pseudomonas putida]